MILTRMVEQSELTRPLFVRATGAGAGGIAVLVLEGADVRQLLQPLFRAKRALADVGGGELLFGRLADATGAIVDEVLAVPIGKKESETGNEQLELSCHGGVGALAAVEEALLAAGFGRGRHTDLLRRGHLNGVLSLVTIEARLRLPAAVTARQAAFLVGHAQLQQRWERLGFDMALGMRQSSSAWRGKLLEEADTALREFRGAKALLSQHHVVLLGPVNAGKSSLANCLARAERHIVCAAPGTTRDRLDTPIEMRGLSLLVTDTAGVRSALDDVEREGQKRGHAAAHTADLRLVVLDGSQPPADADVDLIARTAAAGPLLLVLNKQDLGVDENATGLGFVAGRDPHTVSAKTGAGLDKLMEDIERLLLGGLAPAPGVPFTRRQAGLIEQLKHGLEKNQDGTELLFFVRRLVGTRPDAVELAAVLAE